MHAQTREVVFKFYLYFFYKHKSRSTPPSKIKECVREATGVSVQIIEEIIQVGNTVSPIAEKIIYKFW